MLSIGIDFGTSNSSVAVYDPSAPLRAGAPDVKLLELDAHAKDRRVMRSLLYIPRDGEIVAGQRALDLYTEQNTGREVKMERRYLGEVKMTFSDMEVVKDAYAMVDVNEPGRLFQSLKRFLVMTSFTKTDVFGTEYSLEELVATLAQQMVRAAEAALGSRISSLVVGRPVRFDDDDEKDRGALARLKEAWGRVGLDEVSYMEEPVAAAHHHASEARLVEGTRFLVFDFGGGTLDITVAESVGESIKVLATGGVALGGDLLDSRIMETRIASQFGRGARYEQDGLPVPSHILARLRTWQTIVELNRPDRLDIIRDARRRSDSPRELAALESLVTRNHGLELFRAIERAKITLSDEEQATVRLRADEINLAEPITRDEFEAAISAQVKSSSVCVLDAVRQAGLEPEQIALVITTGGSSLIPVFRNGLREALPNAELTAASTFTSVAAGLALAGGRDG
ncbi:MAG: Hsp70 family protein [Chloroflexi bacterium]|nr:Hsp70 family protein [Chloroflexota bacterium]MCI0856851.1 Hsp70 family protein [Chloroflexota bacterium]MCI0889303.1 Hsp70 family protein [Chloroflexota bacterium]